MEALPPLAVKHTADFACELAPRGALRAWSGWLSRASWSDRDELKPLGADAPRAAESEVDAAGLFSACRSGHAQYVSTDVKVRVALARTHCAPYGIAASRSRCTHCCATRSSSRSAWRYRSR
jgi:hypothetical protein